MTDDVLTRSQPHFQTITSNRLAIERGSLVAGNISFQIRNIASLSVSALPPKESSITLGTFVAAAIVGALVFGVGSQSSGGATGGAIIGLAIVAVFYFRSSSPPDHQLQLLTNAATSFRILHKDEQFLLRLKQAIEEVMQRGDNSVAYHVNIAEQKIDRLEANTTHVTHSPGAAVIGGSAANVQMSTNVVVQGLQDVDTLLRIVEQSNIQNGEILRAQLQTVQQYLAGAKSKEEGKSSWAKFVQSAGSVAKAGNNVWELVARIGALLA
jgi:hypothetical protein